MKIEDLAAPILKTWNVIGGAVLEMTGGDPVETELMLEMCIDADRLAMYGSQEANLFITDYLADHKWDELVVALKPILDPRNCNEWS